MDWGSVGGAALAGALGALIGSAIGALASRLFQEPSRRLIVTIFVVLGAVVAPRLAEPLYERQVTSSSIEAELLNDPRTGQLVSAWKHADPVSFAAAVQQIAASLRAGASRETAVNDFRPVLLAAALPRLAHLDDEQMVVSALLARDEYAELSRAHPSACHPMFNGMPYGDITPYLSQPVRDRELAMLRAAFEADPNAPRNVLRGAEMTTAIDRVVALTRERVGDDIALISLQADTRGRESRYCQVLAEFFGVVAALPEQDAAAFMRGLRALG